MLIIRVPGEPKGKGRPRFFRKGKHVGVYTDDQTMNYESRVAFYASQARKSSGQALIQDGAIEVTIEAIFGMPKSMTKRDRLLVASGTLRPTKTPDLDNLAKMMDALNGVIWYDDKQIVQMTISKYYGDEPELRIAIQPLRQMFNEGETT